VIDSMFTWTVRMYLFGLQLRRSAGFGSGIDSVDIGYDFILCLRWASLCYADDTLLIARDPFFEKVLVRAELSVFVRDSA